MSKTFECRVYFEDTDAGGVVYYANYLKYYERARSEFLSELGFEQDHLLHHNIVFVVRHITVDYAQAARFNERLEVRSKLTQVKKVSAVFAQEIYCQRDGQTVLLNQAEVKVVCVQVDALKPTGIPPEIHQKLIQEIER